MKPIFVEQFDNPVLISSSSLLSFLVILFYYYFYNILLLHIMECRRGLAMSILSVRLPVRLSNGCIV